MNDRGLKMPIYSYQCDNCDYEFDIFQHFSDEALTECPKCHKNTLRKLYTPVGIVFKGSGFYATDHRSPSGMMPSPHEHEAKESSGSESAETEGSKSVESSQSVEKPKAESHASKTKEKAEVKRG